MFHGTGLQWYPPGQRRYGVEDDYLGKGFILRCIVLPSVTLHNNTVIILLSISINTRVALIIFLLVLRFDWKILSKEVCQCGVNVRWKYLSAFSQY